MEEESRAGPEIERGFVKDCMDPYTECVICAECGGHKHKSEVSYVSCYRSTFVF